MRRTAAATLDAGASRVVVVLGANAATIAPAVVGLRSVTIAVNPDWESGLASSLAVGLSPFLADDSCDGVLVTLADQPLVDGAALRRLVTAFDEGHRIVASAYDDTIGVPALLGREHFIDLMRIRGDRGAGSWLRARQDEVTRVLLCAAAVDIDIPSDAARLR
ncbi:MAG: nucleotidyltransferase family protein [Gemmatimonadaceae bacterium]